MFIISPKKIYLFTCSKEKTCQIIGIAHTVSTNRTFQALHCVIDSHARSKLQQIYIVIIRIEEREGIFRNMNKTKNSNVDSELTSPPGPLMYIKSFFESSILSRYNIVASIWLLNSSSMCSPINITRSRYCS